MRNTFFLTFGLPDLVSFGKFRTTGFRQFCLLCLMFGLFSLGSLQAQGPGGFGGPPSDGGERGGRGGRGGFDPAQMISGLDQDRNGVITANEIEQLPGPFRDRLQQSGMDFSRGVRVEDMQQNIQRRMEERSQGGGEEDRGGDRGRGFERSDRPEFNPPQDPGSGDDRNRRDGNRGQGGPNGGGSPSALPGSSSSAKQPRSRISPLLPETYKSLDTDFDGQIALYEWRKGKRGTISQFAQYDYDGDGFLIPKELAKSTVIAAASTSTTTTTTTSVSLAPATPVSAAPSAPVVVSAEAAAEATRSFDLLDTDKSGTVLGREWDKSSRIKPLFVKGGVDLAQPMTKDEFIQTFARVGADK